MVQDKQQCSCRRHAVKKTLREIDELILRSLLSHTNLEPFANSDITDG